MIMFWQKKSVQFKTTDKSAGSYSWLQLQLPCTMLLEMARYLIDEGANERVLNNNGTDLLMYAKDCYLNSGDTTMFEYMLDFGPHTGYGRLCRERICMIIV